MKMVEEESAAAARLADEAVVQLSAGADVGAGPGGVCIPTCPKRSGLGLHTGLVHPLRAPRAGLEVAPRPPRPLSRC